MLTIFIIILIIRLFRRGESPEAIRAAVEKKLRRRLTPHEAKKFNELIRELQTPIPE